MTRRRLKHHWQITGTTQSGKTTFARALLGATPRYVILDLPGDYPDMGSIATSYAEASVMVRDGSRSPQMRVILQADDPSHHLALTEYMWELWTGVSLRPVVIVMDEARRWSNIEGRKRLPAALAPIYTAGLKYGLGTLTIMQFAQQVATEARNAADYRVAFRHAGTLTDDMQTAFGGREEALAQLETLTPGTDPTKGKHYLAYPPDLDPVGAWRSEVVNPMR